MTVRTMPGAEFWGEVWSTLERHKLRALLTASSVFWAMFMLIVLLGMGGGFERGVTRDLGALARRSVYVWASQTRLAFAGFPAARPIRFTHADIERLRRLDGVAHVAPRAALEGQTIRNQSRGGRFRVMGETAELPLVEPIRVDHGRFINARDATEQRKVAVLGQHARRQLFARGENALGQYIEVNGVFFKVIGELSTFRSGEAAQRLGSSVIIPLTTYQSIYGAAGGVAFVTLGARAEASASRVEAAVRQVLGSAHAVDPRDAQAISTANGAETFDDIQGLFAAIRLFVWLIGGATLLTGMLGVGNILAISVQQRTREIGVRRALGATPASLVKMVVAEAMLLTSIAGSAGLMAGVAALEATAAIVASIPDVPVVRPGVGLGTFAVALALLASVGFLVALAPARHAARINPTVALRSQ